VVVAVRRARGFTLLEVLGSLLVLSLGFAAAIGMILYGFHLSKESMARATALATAMSVAVDPHPLQGPGPSSWTVNVPGTSKGYLNSYYIERTEDVATTVAGGIVAADVTVEVYETMRGRLMASYNQRLIKTP
jgi:prepilin-type N-terminal cleavage/methylation domain-containing protein